MIIPGLVSMLIYNNSANPVSLVYNPNLSITSLINPSSNSLSLNNHRILFLWTSLRNFCYSLSLTLSWLSLTSSPSKQFLILSITPSHLFILHILSKHSILFHVTSDKGLEFVLNFFCSLGTALNMQLHFTSGYHHKDDGQTKHTNTRTIPLCIL